jgi:DNA-binding transcriptional MerR regulator
MHRPNGHEGWKIDDLAQRSGVGVDTIRFYFREGLLPPAERQGRALAYNRSHLERLERIRELRDRHFSLAVIKDLADHGRLDLVDRLLGPSDLTFSYDDLIAKAGIDPALADRLSEIGFLAPPQQRKGLGYDRADLRVLQSLVKLLASGMPQGVLLLLAEIYLDQMSHLSEALVATFGVHRDEVTSVVSSEDLEAFFNKVSTDLEVFEGQIDVVMEYLHRRTLEQLVVKVVERVGDAAQDKPGRATTE